MSKFEPYKKALKHIWPIIYRNVFVLVTVIIFFITILLYVFGATQASLFLGIITIVNILFGIIQDARSLVVLEKLQILTALKATRTKDGEQDEIIFADEVKKGDKIKLKIGDQIPCDGVLVSVSNLEISRALITGESNSIIRNSGDSVEAGEIVVSGSAIFEAKDLYSQTRMAKISKDINWYAANPSPIQVATNRIIKYSGYILLPVLIYVVARGYFLNESKINLVTEIGALASMIVPQGLVLITTLLFGFGASNYLSRKVLFQQINATEKIGRIKNLCMDKTGTITNNTPVVDELIVPSGVLPDTAKLLTDAYIYGSGDSSQSILAVKKYLNGVGSQTKILETFPFSLWRQYGAVKMENNGEIIVAVGSADIFLPHLVEEDATWLKNALEKNAHTGKPTLCVVRVNGDNLPKQISEASLSIITLITLKGVFREGVRDAIDFFQNRGVRIRIISGDNVDTVKTIAEMAGIKNTDAFVTGEELGKLDASEFVSRVHSCSIFARVLPEQKLQIIEALKKDGFTAMIGDGVNDALAIKNADLGIAMYDGASVTKQLATIVLMENSFTDLPKAVSLADNFISNMEIFAGIFINLSLVGLFLFIILSIFGDTFPFTPLNITPINYFCIGIPGILISYWAIRPAEKILPASTDSFLSRVLPFASISAFVQALGVAIVIFLNPEYLKNSHSNTLAAFAVIVFGFIFFVFVTHLYRENFSIKNNFQIFLIAIFEIIVLVGILNIPWLVSFFDITIPYPSIGVIEKSLPVFFVFGILQYLIMKYFKVNKK